MTFFSIIRRAAGWLLVCCGGVAYGFNFMHFGPAQRKPVGKIILADGMFAKGEYQNALQLYRQLWETAGHQDPGGELIYKMLVTKHVLEAGDSTLAALEALPGTYPQSPWLPDLFRYLGDVTFKAGDYLLAADYYTRCLYHPLAVGAALPGPFILKYGYCLREVGQDSAALVFLSKCAPDQVIEDYILFWQADCAAKTDSLGKAIALLRRLVKNQPGSLLLDSTYQMLGQALEQQEAYQEALAMYHAIIDRDLKGKAEAWYRIGELQEQLGNDSKALHAYHTVMKWFPRTVWGWKSRINLISLKSRLNQTLDEKECFDNGLVLASHNQPREAITVFEQFMARYPQSLLFAKALFLIGKAHYRLRNVPTALECFKKVVKGYPGSTVAGDALLYSARCYKRQKKLKQSREAYLQLARDFPEHDLAEEAFWIVAWDYESRKDYRQAARIYGELVQCFPESKKGQEAGWRQGFCRYLEGDFDKAELMFKQARQMEQLYVNDQAGYWLGKLYQQQKQPGKAAEVFREVQSHFPRTYYSCRAAAALGQLPEVPFQIGWFKRDRQCREAAQEVLNGFWIQYQDSLWEKAPDSLALTEDRLLKGMRLLALDFRREAEQEFLKLEKAGRNVKSFLFELSRIYMENGLYYRAFRSQFRLLQLLYGQDSDDFPIEELHGLHPLHYYDQIVDLCQYYPNLDPFMVLAIILQESRFHPTARSTAGALGLMQLMPFTGRDMAQRLKIKGYKTESLYNPMLNIRLGMKYLAGQLEKYEGDWAVTLAAYNGGPTNVRRWLSNTGSEDIDLFIECIAFRETRKYVKIVISNYWKYYALWKRVCLSGEE